MALEFIEGKAERVRTLGGAFQYRYSIKAMCCTHGVKANLAQAVVDWGVFPTSPLLLTAATDPITDPALTFSPHLDSSYAPKRGKAVIDTPFA